jgi:hypothetical protein
MISKEDAKKVAEELNTLLGLIPPLDPSEKPEILTEQLKEAAELIVPEDPLSPLAMEVVQAIQSGEVISDSESVSERQEVSESDEQEVSESEEQEEKGEVKQPVAKTKKAKSKAQMSEEQIAVVPSPLSAGVEKLTGKTPFGYKVNSAGGRIDLLFLQGGEWTVDELAAASKATRARTVHHIYALRKKQKIAKVGKKDGKAVYKAI